MGRHRKNTHSVLWDYSGVWSLPLSLIAGFAAGFMF